MQYTQQDIDRIQSQLAEAVHERKKLLAALRKRERRLEARIEKCLDQLEQVRSQLESLGAA